MGVSPSGGPQPRPEPSATVSATGRVGTVVPDPVGGTDNRTRLDTLGLDTAGPSWRAKVGAYVALTKPRIIELLLITTIPVMFLAAQGVPDLLLVLYTCVGGYLSAGGANALNMYIDRDIDALMDRTSQRPLVTGMVSPRECLAFGITLAVVSTLLFGLIDRKSREPCRHGRFNLWPRRTRPG